MERRVGRGVRKGIECGRARLLSCQVRCHRVGVEHFATGTSYCMGMDQ